MEISCKFTPYFSDNYGDFKKVFIIVIIAIIIVVFAAAAAVFVIGNIVPLLH